MEVSEEYVIYSAIIHYFLSDLLDTDPHVKHPFFCYFIWGTIYVSLHFPSILGCESSLWNGESKTRLLCCRTYHKVFYFEHFCLKFRSHAQPRSLGRVLGHAGVRSCGLPSAGAPSSLHSHLKTPGTVPSRALLVLHPHTSISLRHHSSSKQTRAVFSVNSFPVPLLTWVSIPLTWPHELFSWSLKNINKFQVHLMHNFQLLIKRSCFSKKVYKQ